jgi:hypothetical protein
MTHFIGIAAVPDSDVERLDDYLIEKLEKYSENLVVAPYPAKITDKEIDDAITAASLHFDREATMQEIWQWWSGKEIQRGADAWYEVTQWNKLSKWDYYQIGGRFTDFLFEQGQVGDTDLVQIQCLDRDRVKKPRAFIDLDGKWSDRPEEWPQVLDTIDPSVWLVAIDFHV